MIRWIRELFNGPDEPQEGDMVRSAMGTWMRYRKEPKIGPRGGSGASDARSVSDKIEAIVYRGEVPDDAIWQDK